MSLKESYKKLVEQALKNYHLKQIGEYKLYYVKNKKSQGVFARKKGGKLVYLTADPDKVEEKLKEIEKIIIAITTVKCFLYFAINVKTARVTLFTVTIFSVLFVISIK